MGSQLNIVAFYGLPLLLASLVKFLAADFDVTTFGADPTGNLDSTEGIMAAWRAGCESGVRDRVVVPEGTFSVTGQVAFSGEGCATPPNEFHVIGNLVAGDNTTAFSDTNIGWFILYKLRDFTLSGPGSFDGKGSTAWEQSLCSEHASSCTLLSIDSVTNSMVSDLTFVDSKMFHIGVFDSKAVTFQNLTIKAPAISPNTDGIHVARSEAITIRAVSVETGDDCVSIGDGSKDVIVTDVVCGPGHGISIGSLGKYENEMPVAGVSVTDCTLNGTTNGVRVKTIRGSSISTSVNDVVFRNITMIEVSNPIIIDQKYCPHGNCDGTGSSHVQIDNVRFDDIRGSSATANAVILDCSSETRCRNLNFGNIDLTYNGGAAHTFCRNAVDLQFNSTQNPAIVCDDN